MKLHQAIDLFASSCGGVTEKKETIETYARDARQFCLYMRNPSIEEVKVIDCEQYLHDMKEAGFQQNNVVHKAAALRRLFRFLKRRGFRVLEPTDIPIPRKEFKLPHVAEDWQIKRVLAFLSERSRDMRIIRNRTILLMLRDTGMRLGELLRLNISHIDMKERKAIVQTGKARGLCPIRVAFWFDDCQKTLVKWLEVRKQLKRKFRFEEPDALFVGLWGNRAGKRLGHSGVEIALRKLSRFAGVPTINPHSLRHRKGRLLRENGASNSTISGVLGHFSLASSYIYTMMDDQDLATAARIYGDEDRKPDFLIKEEQREELKERTRKLYKHGLSMRDVAINVGRSHQWVWRVLKEDSLSTK